MCISVYVYINYYIYLLFISFCLFFPNLTILGGNDFVYFFKIKKIF